MSQTDEQLLAKLNEAIATGVSMVTHNGKTIQYRKLDDMIRARNDLMRRLGLVQNQGGKGSVYAPTFSRGYH